MKNNFAVIAFLAASTTATTAYARCDDVMTLIGPGTDDTAELAACVADKILKQSVHDENVFLACVADQLDLDYERIYEMGIQDLVKLTANGKFNEWLFEKEVRCHLEKAAFDATYNPLDTISPAP